MTGNRAGIRYTEFDPHPALRKLIACYWTMSGEASMPGTLHRVFPDNCIDIIFDFGDSWSRKDSSGLFTNARKSYVVGTMSRPIIVELGRYVSFLGIRFRPGKAHSFFNFSVAEITDQTVSLEDIWRDTAGSLEYRFEGLDLHQRLRLLDQELISRIRFLKAADPVVDQAISGIVLHQGSVPIEMLSSTIGVSRQHLTRKFQEQVGIGPKLFARVTRFRSLLRKIRNGQGDGWSLMAQDVGYFDQSHMISEFQEFTGQSPTQYYSQKFSQA